MRFEFRGLRRDPNRRLFHDYSCPASFAGLIQASSFQVLKNRIELIGSSGEIKDGCRGWPWFLIDFIEAFGQ